MPMHCHSAPAPPRSAPFLTPLHSSFKFHGKTLQMYFAVSSPLLLLLPTAFVTSFSLVFARYFYTFCFSFSFLRCVFVGICCAMWHVQLLPCPMSSSLFPVACRLPHHSPPTPLLSACCNCPTSVHSKLLCLPPH